MIPYWHIGVAILAVILLTIVAIRRRRPVDCRVKNGVHETIINGKVVRRRRATDWERKVYPTGFSVRGRGCL